MLEGGLCACGGRHNARPRTPAPQRAAHLHDGFELLRELLVPLQRGGKAADICAALGHLHTGSKRALHAPPASLQPALQPSTTLGSSAAVSIRPPSSCMFTGPEVGLSATPAGTRYGGRRPGRPSGGRPCGRPAPEHAGPDHLRTRASTNHRSPARPASDYRASVAACAALTRGCGWRYRYNSCSGRWCDTPPAPSHHSPGARPLFGQPGRTFHATHQSPTLWAAGACSLL